MPVTLVSSLPFSFSITGAYEALPLQAPPDGYPWGGYGVMSWSIGVRVENGSSDVEDLSIGEFLTRPAGTPFVAPDTISDDGPIIVSVFNLDVVGATVTTTTTYETIEHDGYWYPTGNIRVLVVSSIPLTVHDLDVAYVTETGGGFSASWVGYDANVSQQWDPLPRFSENPGIDPEVALDPGIYAITYYDYPGSVQWFEGIELLVDGSSGGGGGGGVVDNSLNLRVWGFSLDGHDYFVLRVGASETLVYDLTTSQWAHWQSPNQTVWRAHVGQNWVGMAATTVAHGFGTDIVAGDDVEGVLWILDPAQGVDDNPTTGTTPFTRKVTGGIQLSGRETAPCGALQLSLTVGAPETDADAVSLRFSNDHGHTWVSAGSRTLTGGDYSTVVEWRGMGLMRAPGRIFEISDNGATVRIGKADLR